ncbi:Uridine kinase [Actinomyces denticolens]|uniref:Uridine kinase n=1 Tax=Actinomyces denticolens TaxID=52767 RepID=A0ABY1IFL5_9ACTO|nr:hypothetical protein [Actinomyces denticolens]SHJ10139.1 Uridine kinase [Actinomyces denticolens]
MAYDPAFHAIAARPDTKLQPEEPAVSLWRTTDAPALMRRIQSVAGQPSGRPAVIAVDGRSGSGKTTLASRLLALLPLAHVLRIDDLDWNEPLYQWDHLLVDALTRLRATGALDFTPPAWPAHGRTGSIIIPADTPLVLVEGTGAGMRAVTELIDAHVWVQTDDSIAEERGIARDILDGINGDESESVRFWNWWMAAERPFFAADRPWERADVVVSGEHLPGLRPEEIAWTPGPLAVPAQGPAALPGQ